MPPASSKVQLGGIGLSIGAARVGLDVAVVGVGVGVGITGAIVGVAHRCFCGATAV